MKKLSTLLILLVCSTIHMMAQIINVPTDKITIQAAIDSALTGDTVLVAEGTYYENINFRGKAITVASSFILDGDTSHISKTIIDGNHFSNLDSSSTVSFCSGEDTTSILEGFTITGGNGTNYTVGSGTSESKCRGGGGIFIYGSGGKIAHNIIEENHVEKVEDIIFQNGGGLFAFVYNNHSAVIRDNLIRNNSINGENAFGGGISAFGGMILFEGNVITHNSANSDLWVFGGGLNWESIDSEGVIKEVIIRNNLISHNFTDAVGEGGGAAGINIASGHAGWHPLVYNNIIHNNHTQLSGGGAFFQGFCGNLVNNTIVNNSAGWGNNIAMMNVEEFNLYNNIIWSPYTYQIKDIQIWFTSYANLRVFNNLLLHGLGMGSFSEFDNIYAEPTFQPGSFNLAGNSPGIDMGVDSVQIEGTWYHAPSFDYYWNVRPNPASSHPDLGAIESPYERIVHIPDTAFLCALIEQGMDINGDSLISFTEAEEIITLRVDDRNIKDMTGLEAMINLVYLNCTGNLINSLDVSENASLQILVCSDNQINNLNVSNNTYLATLYCNNNLLTNLDVSNKTELSKFFCENNQLTSLNVLNAGLQWFDCSYNQLTSLDVSTCTSLRQLNCSNNKLTTLDISRNQEILAGCPGGSGANLSNMPSLQQVCVPGLPFPPPPGCVEVIWTGSPNVYFSDCVAPELFNVDSVLYHPGSINATSTEDGMIYCVPDSTEKELAVLREKCLDSIQVFANIQVQIEVSELGNGSYRLYAVDESGNVSEPKTFTVMGVGTEEISASGLKLYPNPVNDLLSIQTAEPGNHWINITSMNGQLMYSSAWNGTIHQIDLSSYRKGVYVITIKSKDLVTTKKIIKL
jgi:hypothetical protein